MPERENSNPTFLCEYPYPAWALRAAANWTGVTVEFLRARGQIYPNDCLKYVTLNWLVSVQRKPGRGNPIDLIDFDLAVQTVEALDKMRAWGIPQTLIQAVSFGRTKNNNR